MMCMRIFLLFIISSLCCACNVSKQLQKSATKNVLSNATLQTAHVGISIYEPASGKYWFNYQGDKYFVPASNTKLATCYAAMKYLGDSLVGLRYGVPTKYSNTDSLSTIVIWSSGDPTFLHEDYPRQNVFSFLKTQFVYMKKTASLFIDLRNKFQRWGTGWSWNDYEQPYMAERSEFPIFGNVINMKLLDISERISVDSTTWREKYKLVKTQSHYLDSLVNDFSSRARYDLKVPNPKIRITRNISKNSFGYTDAEEPFTGGRITFVSDAYSILEDSLKIEFGIMHKQGQGDIYIDECAGCDFTQVKIKHWNIIHSQPTDSLLKPMMHRSDNFFAEQALLMVSNEHLGFMNDEKIIDAILKTDFNDLPQKPRWVDGSGLSRYNLFSPQDFVTILHKMKTEFGMPRIKNILATGGEGTISNYYVKDKGFIYAKTGTLSGVVALSGFLYTKKGKELIFSVLVNNHQGSATEVRRAVEKFIEGVRDKY